MGNILEVQNITKRFGGLLANQDITFSIERGSVVGLVGPNGAGKTTLFNSISRVHTITAGKILFDGINITKKKSYEVCRLGIGRTYQIPQTLEDMSVIENIMVGALWHAKNVEEAEAFSCEVSRFCSLESFNDKTAGDLNVMQKKRLEIARALAGKPKLLLLDEVMAGLRGSERQEAIELIQKINQKGITILMIEHVMDVVMAVSKKIIVINSGKLLTEGTPQKVASDPVVIEAYLGG